MKIIDHHHDKYITPIISARLPQANVANKSDIANCVKMTDFDDKLKKLNKKMTSNKSKHLLFENELKKLLTFDSKLFYWSKLLF